MLVGALLNPEVYAFFEKIGADFQSLFEDRLAAAVEAFQLNFCEGLKRGVAISDVDRSLFRESVRCLELLGESDRCIKEDTIDGIVAGKYPGTKES